MFNFARARAGPPSTRGELVVVEGYMDVIALHQAGFHHVVATLGTAFTERQMDQLWLLAPEPIICFDGDRAGEAAAARAIDRMLPSLREGHSFRFAFLPQGSDPDDLVRNRGRWRSRTLSRRGAAARSIFCGSANAPAHNLDTPERRAALEERLEQLLATIANARVRDHYRRDIKSRLFALWRDIGKRSGVSGEAVVAANSAGKSEAKPLPSAHGFAITIILALAHHPSLLDHFAEEVAHLDIRQKQLAELLGFLTEAIFHDHGITRERLAELHARQPPRQALRHALIGRAPSSASPSCSLRPLRPRSRSISPSSSTAGPRSRASTRRCRIKRLDLADLSEADFEHFAELQRQVANAGPPPCRRRRRRPRQRQAVPGDHRQAERREYRRPAGAPSRPAPDQRCGDLQPAPLLHCEHDVNVTTPHMAKNYAFEGLCGLDTSP